MSKDRIFETDFGKKKKTYFVAKKYDMKYNDVAFFEKLLLLNNSRVQINTLSSFRVQINMYSLFSQSDGVSL